MGRVMWMVVLGALAVASLLQVIIAQTVHVVGDNIGWAIPNNGAAAYTNWASGKTFRVGDILAFNFERNEHDVLQVPKASFDACSAQNAIGNPIMTGPANVTIASPGDHYYICTFGRHCQAGQKLAITVSGSSTPGANPPTPSTPTPFTPVVPSPSSSNQPDACAPTPAATGPSGSNTPNERSPPPPSSSTSVLASFLLIISSIALAIFL